jgi:hypothetical protein
MTTPLARQTAVMLVVLALGLVASMVVEWISWRDMGMGEASSDQVILYVVGTAVFAVTLGSSVGLWRKGPARGFPLVFCVVAFFAATVVLFGVALNGELFALMFLSLGAVIYVRQVEGPPPGGK